MAHKVTPLAYRLGKTFIWRDNVIIPSSSSGPLVKGANTLALGLEKVVKYNLKQKRLLVVNGTLSYSAKLAALKFTVLFLPCIKPKEPLDSFGNFAQTVFHGNLNYQDQNVVQASKLYIDERRVKEHIFSVEKEYQINRWLTRRMLRCSSHLQYVTTRKKTAKRKILKYSKLIARYKLLLGNSLHHPTLLACLERKIIKLVALQQKLRMKSAFARQNFRMSQKMAFKKLPKKYTWSKRWLVKQAKRNSGLGQRSLSNWDLSNQVSNVVGQTVKVKAINIFTYLAAKNMIKYKTHQEHFWNHNYHRLRHHYANYYDIVNSFFILGILKNSENVLLELLRLVLPRIYEIRRFMYFLSTIIKNMSQIKDNFSCFRLTLTGKISGGTKRTQVMTVGFGDLPVQSLFVESSNGFTCYWHKFGAFGIKLLMNRTLTTSPDLVSKSWAI